VGASRHAGRREVSTDAGPGRMPAYKGEPLDPERGPGLGCFWIQVVVLAIALVATPLSVVADFPTWASAALLIITLVLLLFVGQTVIFLLRLVAADRRSRRRPLAPTARRTVGDLEEAAAAPGASGAAGDPGRGHGPSHHEGESGEADPRT